MRITRQIQPTQKSARLICNVRCPMIPAELGDIRIRYPEQGDADTYIAQEKDSVLKRFMGGANKRSDADLRWSLKDCAPSFNFMAIADAATNAYIGRCGYLNTESPDTKELYVLLGHEWQKNGRGKRVAQFLVQLVLRQGYLPVAYVDPENTSSIKMLDSLNWRREGTVVSKKYQNGHYIYVPPSTIT